MLDPVEGAAQYEYRDADPGERHADVAAEPPEQVEPRGDARELRAHRPDVRDHEGGPHHTRVARTPVLADQGQESAFGDNPHTRADQMKDDQRGGR
jgi:hypothetical protein